MNQKQKEQAEQAQLCSDVPMPIVRLNRWTLLTGISLGLVFQQPLVTTFLFLILLPAVLWGQRRSLIFQWRAKTAGSCASTIR